ncbi:alpha/beta hydrolase [Nocardia sp. NPDC059764]|uniref:alpha/beta hydrolase n=1 Tax=Nocardia sp. NPDC059764 TaxID=3346939 RepID=UPI003669351E
MIWEPPLAGTLGWLVGMKWPDGNEDSMWGIADDWKASAQDLRSIDADIDDAIAAVRKAYPTGDGGDKIIEQLRTMRVGDQSIDKLAEWFETIAGTAENTGTELEYTKLMFYTTLITLAADIAAAWLFPPTAPMAEGAAIGIGRIAVRILTRRAINFLGKEGLKATQISLMRFALRQTIIGGALGALQDGGIQAYQHEFGRRSEINTQQVLLSAGGGAAGGLVAAPIGRWLPQAMVNQIAKAPIKRITAEKASNLLGGGIAGGVAGLAGWAVSGGVTHNWHFDPRVVTGGIAGGTLPGLAHEGKSPWKGSPDKLGVTSPTVDGSPLAVTDKQFHPSATNDVALTGNSPHEAAPSHEKNTVGTTPGEHPQGRVADPQPRTADPGTVKESLAGVPKADPVVQVPVHSGPVVDARPVDTPHSSPAHTPASGEPKHVPAAAPRTETPVAARPETTVAARAEAPAPGRADAPGTHTQPAEPRATPAAIRDAGSQPTPMTARATGLEVPAGRVGERVDLADPGRAVESTARPERELVGAGTGPESRIGARPEHAAGSPEQHGPRRTGDQTPDSSRPGDHPVGDQSARHAGDTTAERPVLPEDSPISEAEHVHAREALQQLHPDGSPEHLLHPSDTDIAGAHNRASENHEWWHGLTPEQQHATIKAHPHEVGNADGLPPHVKDEANRLAITRDLNALHEQNPRIEKWTSRFTDPENFQQWKNLESTRKALEEAHDLAAKYADKFGCEEPPVHVLSYDSKEFNGEGRAVVAFGDTSKASSVSFHVPGITTTVRSLEGNLENAFNHMWETAQRTQEPDMVASIAWIGYDAPSGFPKIVREMTDARLAQRGGELLARDVASFSQTRRLGAELPGGHPTPDVHLFGHSYGSTTTSFAGAGGRLHGDISTITLLGSPGSGPVGHAADFGIGAHTIGEIGRVAPKLGMGLGMDPAIEAFGARRVAAQFPGGTHTLSDISTHTGYYNHMDEGRSVPSESLHNFSRIASGQTPHLLPEYSRPGHEDLNARQRTLGSSPHDPARFRAPETESHQGEHPYGYDDLVHANRTLDPPAAPERTHTETNDCGPQALRQVQELTGNPNIHVPDDPTIADHGMTAAELEHAAGAHLDRHETLGSIADQLHRLGDGATALVVDEFHGPTDANGVGAHAYTITNAGGRLVVHDNAVPSGPHPFPPDHTNVKSTHAIVFDSHGNPVRPLESVPRENPVGQRPEARIGQPDSHPAGPEHANPAHVPDGAEPARPKLPVEGKPYYANPRYQDPTASHEYAAKNRISHGEVQTIRDFETANHPEISRLTDSELDAIRRNQGFNLNEPVNEGTRNGNPTALADHDVEIRTLVSAYNKLPDHEGTVYRSLYFDDPVALERFLEAYSPGKEPPADPGFASADKDSSMPGGNVELIIDSHTGKDISWASLSQEEVVFPPGTRFQVESRDLIGGKYVVRLTDIGRTPDAHQPGGNGTHSAEGSGPHDAGRDRGPGTPGEARPRLGDPAGEGREGTPPGHRGPDQDLAGMGRVGDRPDQPGTGREHLTGEDSAAPNRATEPEQRSPSNHFDPTLERPSALTPHLASRFEEMRAAAGEIAKAHYEPTRTAELPALREKFVEILDRVGLMDPRESVTPWRLLKEYDPALARYFEQHHETLLPKATEPAAPHAPEPTPHETEPATHPTESQNRPTESDHRQNPDSHQDSDHGAPDRTHTEDPLSHFAERTPAGLSLHDEPEMRELARQVPEDPRYFTIDAHLTERGTVLLDGREYTMEQLATRLRELGYDGRPIRLVGCDAASTDAAARLAKATGNDVLAPTKPAWTDPQGRLYSSDATVTPEGTRRPRIPPDGDWELVHPDGTKTKVSEDGFVPGTREEDKQSLSYEDARDRGGEGPREPQYDIPGRDREIREGDPDFDDPFVEWDRPTHKPPDPLDPQAPRQPVEIHDEIKAAHRDRETVPDGNRAPDQLSPVEHPEVVPVPLRAYMGDEPLKPWSAYPVVNENGTRTTFFTNGDGLVKWVEAIPGSRSQALNGKGPWSGFNPDLSHPLLPDVQYQVPNFHNPEKVLTFHTDMHGQTDALTGDVEVGGQNGNFRDDDGGKGAQQRAFQEGESAYPSDPPGRSLSADEIELARIKWAGGHLMANELGGLGEYLNMHPQMAASNSGNNRDGWVHAASWRAKENQLVAFAREEHQDIRDYQVKMTREVDGVANEVVMRWQEVTYARNDDGSVRLGFDGNPIVESVVTKERVFPNRGANFGPQDRYSKR